MTVQELANQQARRAAQLERKLREARQLNAQLMRERTILQNEIQKLRGATNLGRYHRYWIRRFTPEQVVELARGLD